MCGWRAVVSSATCQACTEQGRDAPEGARIRQAAAERVVAGASKRVEAQAPTVLRVLAEKHGSPEARTVLDYAEVDPYATPKLGWEKVKGTFQAAADFAAAIKSRGLSDRRVDLSLRVIRDQSCFAEPCPSVRLAEDGVHHFCAACGCGDREIAHLDGDDYPKLDYPDLKCPRRRPGFSNSLDPVVVNAFDQVVCINLTRRRDRWDAFAAGIREMDWPFRPVKRFAAVDGHAEPPPKSWKAGKGAWGCM